MSYLQQPPVNRDEIPTLGMIQDQFGFVPNFYLAQTMRPDLIDAEALLVGSALVTQGALTRQQKEYIFLVCSAANLSTYCVTAHCEIVRMLGIQGPEPELIAFDHTAADIPMQLKALLNFALKLNNQPTRFGSRDVDALRTFGYTEQQILEAVVIVGAAKFANCVSFGLGTAPDFDSSKVRLPGGVTSSVG